MSKSIIVIVVISFLMVSALIFAFKEVGSPSDVRGIKQDRELVSRLYSTNSSIIVYLDKNGTLPLNLTDAVTGTTSTGITYKVLSQTKYNLCATFESASSSEAPPIKAYENVNFDVHPKGYFCFALNETPLQKTQVPKQIIDIPQTPPTTHDPKTPDPVCTLQLGYMITDTNGKGTIGCDVDIYGEFDLSKSYCQGQTTFKKATLQRGNQYLTLPNRYYATLTGLDPTEEVKVFAAGYSGRLVECTP